MSERMRRAPGWLWMGLGVFLLLMVRNCAAGPVYWPQLDDYIQLWNYPTADSFAALAQSTGLLASRPLAGVADYYVWGRLNGCMLVGCALISLLYAVTAVALRRLVDRYFPTSPIFLVVMALLPLGMEGTYWMSAANRVVVGLFFAALAACAFARWLDGGRWGWGLLYAVLQILPFGFYEQAGILGVTLVMGMAILEWLERCPQRRRGLLALWGLPAMLCYLLLVSALAEIIGGVYGSRTALISPFSRYYWTVFLPDLLRQLWSAFGEGGFYTLAKGFVRSVRMILSGELLAWALLLLAACGLFLWLALRFGGGGERDSRHGPLLAFFCGLLLFLAPLSLFFLLETSWFSLRNTVTSFPGIALMADAVILGVWRRLPGFQRGPAVLAAAMALVFCAAGASEVWDYRGTYENDQKVARLILDSIPPEGGSVGILGVEPSSLPNQNYFWHEHIHGCTESSWAMQGLLTTVSGGGGIPMVTPLPADPIYERWNQAANRPEGFDRLYWYDPSGEGSLTPVTLSQTGEHDFDVLLPDGSLLGVVWEESDGLGYFRLAQP